MLPRFSRRLVVCLVAAVTAGCAGSAGRPLPLMQLSTARESLTTPALLAVDSYNGRLQYWPVAPHGGSNPAYVSNPVSTQAYAMAAHGRTVAIANANQASPSVILYDLSTNKEQTLADPYGLPIDVAIGKDTTAYALDFVSAKSSNVAVYAPGSPHPTELTCRYVNDGVAIAVDNEGDVFVNGYGPSFTGVEEIPKGGQSCIALALKSENAGYVAGLAVDPKTDDLIVLDDPDDCAGGVEGRMTIYPKPYKKDTAVRHDLGANCAGGIRLSADSSRVYVNDTSVDESYGYILQRSYPDGRDMGAYYGGSPSAMTTIPNTLPN